MSVGVWGVSRVWEGGEEVWGRARRVGWAWEVGEEGVWEDAGFGV